MGSPSISPLRTFSSSTCSVTALLMISLSMLYLLQTQMPTTLTRTRLNDNTTATSNATSISSTTTTASCATFPEHAPLLSTPSDAPSSIAQYARWHKKARACLNSATTRECKSAPPPRVLVWRCPKGGECSGLADRIRGTVMTLFLSIMTQRAFFIMWPLDDNNPVPITTGLAPAAIDWRPPPALLRLIEDAEKGGGVGSSSATRTTRAGGKSVGEVLQINWVGVQSVPDGLPLPGKVRNWMPKTERIQEHLHRRVITMAYRPGYGFIDTMQRNNELTRDFPDMREKAIKPMYMRRALMQTLFQPSDAVRALLPSVVPPILFGPYVAVHARTGDDVGEGARARFDRLRSSTRSENADRMLACAARADPVGKRRVFLASDSTAFKAEFLKVAALRNVSVATSDVPAMTMAHDGVEKFERDARCSGFLNIFVDLFLLARGNAIITTGSGFSRTAMYLSNATGLFNGVSDSTQEIGEVSAAASCRSM